jgi:uncharacterized membrane protein
MPQDDAGGRNGRHHDTSGAEALLGALRSKELLVPAALSAAGVVAASKGPDLLRRLTSSTEEQGENEARKLGEQAASGATDAMRRKAGGGVAGKALSKALGGGSGGGKKTRRLPIQRWTDVAVPVEEAYRAWTQFERYPQFMHRVLNVQQRGDDAVEWQEKIWFSTRRWRGRITDRRPNDRIAWKTTAGMNHSGVVSFHRLDDRLTRVMVTMEFEPNGMIEKMASGLRFVKRAVQADLARFKAFVEFEQAKGLSYRSSGGGDQQSERSQGDGGASPRSTRERSGRRREREQSRARRRASSSA